MSYQTFKEAKYKYVRFLGNNEHLVQDEDGELEVFFCNKNHASWGLIYKNTHLEFAHKYENKS